MKQEGAAARDSDELTDAELEKFERLLERKKAKETAVERERLGLTTEPTLRRNETGKPFYFTSGCTAGDRDRPKEIRCDGSGVACRQALKSSSRPTDSPLAAPGELFWVPAGHRKGTLNAATPEIDPASVADEPTAQDRLVLGELRAFKQGAEGPANQAARTLADLEAQEKILAERKAQQREEVERRQSHVRAAEAKIEEFLSSLSEKARESLLAGSAEAALEAAKRAAAEEARRSPEIHTVDDLRRAAAGDPGPAAYIIGPGGQPVRLKAGRS